MTNMNQALGEETIIQSTAAHGFCRFASDRFAFEDAERSGRLLEVEETPLATLHNLSVFRRTAIQNRLHAFTDRLVLVG